MNRLLTKLYNLTILSIVTLAIAGCGGGGGGGTPSVSMAGMVTTGLSDPPSCKASLSAVYVTIADVKASIKGSAESDDPSFVDLTPGLSKHPIQVNLLGTPNANCLLASLGSTTGLPTGTYQQIRIILVGNNATGITLAGGATNQCAGVSGYNCAVDAGGTMHLLSLPSEAETGIKIPSGEIESDDSGEDSGGGTSASHGLTIGAGQGLDLAIDFNACASVVKAGASGRYNLKPTLRAAELGLNPLIAGDVVMGSASGASVSVPATPVAVPSAVVYLEQQSKTVPVQGTADSDTVENYIGSITTDSKGHFEFCPVAPASYEIVADAATLPGGGESNATVTTGVNVTTTGGPNNLVIPLVAETAAPASVQAAFTTANSGPSVVDDITVNHLQQFTDSGGNQLQALIPFFTFNGAVATTPAVTTTAAAPGANCTATTTPAACAGNTHCACVSYTAPNSNLVVGAASTDGSGYTLGTSTTVSGALDAAASQTGSSGAMAVCSPSELATQPFTLLSGPPPVDAGSVDFSSCD